MHLLVCPLHPCPLPNPSQVTLNGEFFPSCLSRQAPAHEPLPFRSSPPSAFCLAASLLPLRTPWAPCSYLSTRCRISTDTPYFRLSPASCRAPRVGGERTAFRADWHRSRRHVCPYQLAREYPRGAACGGGWPACPLLEHVWSFTSPRAEAAALI